MTAPFILFAIIALIVIVAILKTAIVVPQKTAYIVERLGKYSCTLDAGFHILIPFQDLRQTIRNRSKIKTEFFCLAKVSKSNDNNALPFLRNAKIQSVQYFILDVITKMLQYG